MARSSTVTQLSLDDFAKILGIHPLHFNGVVAFGAEGRTCGIPILQYSWQDADRTGREEIAEAIYAAEQEVIKWLGYNVKEIWTAEEQRFSAYDKKDFNGLSRLHLNNKQVLYGGVRATTLIDDDVGVVYSDVDGDGYKETATVTLPFVGDASELEIYYPDKGADDSWRVQCTSKSIVGLNAVLTTRRERLVNENLMESLNIETNAIEGAVDASFLSLVDVYRVYNDPSRMVDFVVSTCCGNAGCVECTYGVQSGCMSILNGATGYVQVSPGNWDAVNNSYTGGICFNGWCDRLKLNYKSGARSHKVDQAISYLALTYLDRPICTCNNLEHITRWWTKDMAERTGDRSGSISYQLSKGKLDNPFGTTRAGLAAWRIISDG